MNPPRYWQLAATTVLALAATLLLSGCNLSTKANSNTPGGQATAALSLSSTSLSFGSVAVGSSKTMHLTLTNSTAAGGPSVTLSQVTVTGTGFSTTNNASISLAPSQSADIAVVFQPAAAGNASGSLSMDVAGASNPATVSLSGTGSSGTTPAAQLSVSPTTLAFGSVNVGTSKNLTGTLQATNADVTVASAAWNGSGYAVSGITFPATVKAGTSKSFTVTFTPPAGGAASGQVSFTSNAANSPAVQSLSGTGVQTALQHTVSLTWIPSTSTVSGYNVYRGDQSGGPYARLNPSLRTSTNYADSTVQSGHVYYYVATAVDSNAVESAYSGEVATVVPTP